MKDIINKIDEFSNLPEGWDFGQGIATLSAVALKAKQIVEAVDKIFEDVEYDTTPMTDGGLILILKMDNEFIDVTINTDLSLDMRHEKGIGVEYDIIFEMYNVSIDQIIKLYSDNF